jgi:hypothetical protein
MGSFLQLFFNQLEAPGHCLYSDDFVYFFFFYSLKPLD